LLWGADLDQVLDPHQLAERLTRILVRPPIVVGPTRPMKKIGWCTGAAQGMIEQAAQAGCDAFVSGEISEQTLHQANELGICYFAAGHHATERYGVQALGRELADRFGIVHEFINLDNPA
jgi:putative NIF3 family GTP cyclohydrolase 1 type 2